MAGTQLQGRCFCGAVSWLSNGPVLWAGHCHCESCRRITASPMTSFIGVPRASVRWKGKLSQHPSAGGQVERQFCAVCGSPMSYQSSRFPDETHVYAATLDDPSMFKPQAHYHYAEKLPWLQVTDDLKKHAGSSDDPPLNG